MRSLADQDVYASTVALLREHGRDVLTARKAALSTATDRQVLARASQKGRILITRDRDFGALVFLRRIGAGVLYLRMSPEHVPDTHAQLLRVLEHHEEGELAAAFVTVEPGRYRLRRLPR